MSELLLMFANVLAMLVAAVSLPYGGATFIAYLWNKMIPQTSMEKLQDRVYEMRTGFVRTYSFPFIRRLTPGVIASIWLLSAWYTGNFL